MQTLLLTVCDAPKAQYGQIVLLALACPFGTSQTPDFGVCASRDSIGGMTLTTHLSAELGHLVRSETSRHTNCPQIGGTWVVRVF